MKENINPEKRWFLTTYKIVIGKSGAIEEIPKDSDDLGYTNASGKIFINFFHEMIKELPAAYRPAFRAGVFTHEMMHQKFTDFEHMNTLIAQCKSEKEREILRLFINVIEDPAIEHFANQAVGGWMLKGLDYSIEQIYLRSPEINPEDETFSQLVNALIQFGDMGLIKGHLSDEAFAYLKEIAPEFDRMIKEPVSKIRMDYAKKWANATKKLWENGADAEKIKKDNMISDTEGTSPQQEMPEEIKSAGEEKKDLIRGKSLNEIEKGSMPEINGEKLETMEPDPKLAEGIEQVLRNNESEDDVVKSMSAVKNKIREYEMPGRSEHSVHEETVYADSGDLNAYNGIVDKMGSKIRVFTESIKNLFLSDYDEEVRAKTGKYNIVRGEIGTSVKIFDKYKEMSHTSEAVVILLVDMSGSMSGRNIKEARDAAIFLAESFNRLHLPCAVVGFTADVKASADIYQFVPFSNKKGERVSLMQMKAMANNYDSFAIRYATAMLAKRREENKLLFVISDGYPACRSYKSREYGIQDTADAVKEAISKRIKVMGISIAGEDRVFERMYRGMYTNTVPENLSNELARQLKRLLR